MITVLRLGHRRGRDDRISSHVGLTARQFGADKVIYSGEKDDNMLESLEDVRDRWGGDLDITYREDYRRVIKDFEGTSVHLTMYGLPFREEMDAAREAEDILVVVGSQKVPREVYELVDHNLAVGNQPHSEVTATGIFLYELQDREIPSSFPGAAIEVEPSADQKLTREPE
jgi:tRNA (cytidine56-2'-O)-methyltransferase